MAIAIKPLVFTLSAIAVIDEGELSHVNDVLAFLIFVVAAQLLVLSPVIISIAVPTRAAKLLDAIQSWLQRHNKVLTIVASLVFGSWFFYKGASSLVGRNDATQAASALQFPGVCCARP
jgi:hypothetical protein